MFRFPLCYKNMAYLRFLAFSPQVGTPLPSHGSFHKWGYPKFAGWFFSRENPNLKWMITGGTPISGNIHIWGVPLFQETPPFFHYKPSIWGYLQLWKPPYLMITMIIIIGMITNHYDYDCWDDEWMMVIFIYGNLHIPLSVLRFHWVPRALSSVQTLSTELLTVHLMPTRWQGLKHGSQ